MRDRGFNEEKANEIVPNTAVIGELKQEVAEQIHFPTGIKVVAGAMAVTTSAFGSGAIDDYQPFYYLGSSSWFAVHLPEPPRRKKVGIQVNQSNVPGKYLLSSNQPAATANLNYLRDMVFFPGDESVVLYHQKILLDHGSNGCENFARQQWINILSMAERRERTKIRLLPPCSNL